MSARQALFAAILAAALALPAGAHAGVPDDMKALIERGQAAEAYALGLKHEDLIGDTFYDYYFGIAAVEAGRVALGVLALERVILANPDNDVARLELARAYFVLEDDQRAKDEFQNVLARKPPPGVVATVEKFLDAIKAREGRFATKWTGFLEAGAGYNSNVNYGPVNATMNIPGLRAFFPELGANPLIDLGIRNQSSAFQDVAGGVQVVRPVAPGIQAVAAVNGSLRLHSQVDGFDQLSVGAGAGLAFDFSGHKSRVLVSQSQVSLDNKVYRNSTGLGGNWSRELSKTVALRASALRSAYRHPGDNRVRDADYTQVAGGLTRKLEGAWSPALLADLTVADEHNIAGRPDLGRQIFSARLAVGFSPAGRWNVLLGMGLSRSDYRGEDILFLKTRRDVLRSADLGVQYQFDRALSLRFDMLLAGNDSNIPLYEHDQRVFGVRLRYDWR